MKDKILTSSSNPLFKTLKSLLTSSGIRSEEKCLVPGAKLVQEILAKTFSPQNQGSSWKPHSLLVPQGFDFSFPKDIQKIELSKDLFRELDVLGTGHPLLLCQIPKTKETDFSQEPEGLEIIAPLQDPQNLGALIRSAAAFGVHRIHLTRESCNPYLPRALKSSANGILHIELRQIKTLDPLQSSKQNIFILDSKGEDLRKFLALKKSVRKGYLLLGEEGQGQSKVKPLFTGANSRLVSIPTKNVESLNVTVASSIFLYEWSRE